MDQFLVAIWSLIWVLGGRYFGLSLVFHLFARRRANAVNEFERSTAAGSIPFGHNMRKEMLYSLGTVAVFSCVSAMFVVFGWWPNSQIYYEVDDYPLWWIPLSVLLALLFQDFMYYWVHRAMHLPVLYRHVHHVHHRSIRSTAFSAYCLDPLEALFQMGVFLIVLYTVPMHFYAVLAFETILVFISAYGHSGRDPMPRGAGAHWLGKWINSPSNHAYHHVNGSKNYGFSTTVWDVLLGTSVMFNAGKQ